jgi:hypothetical protein
MSAKVMPAAVNFFQTLRRAQGPGFCFFHRKLIFWLLVADSVERLFVYVLGAKDNETRFTFSSTTLIRLFSSCVAPAAFN